MDQNIQNLIDGLNEDLAHEYGAAIQYTYSASVVSGLYRSALKPFFENEINDEMGHALYLSEKSNHSAEHQQPNLQTSHSQPM